MLIHIVEKEVLCGLLQKAFLFRVNIQETQKPKNVKKQ